MGNEQVARQYVHGLYQLHSTLEPVMIFAEILCDMMSKNEVSRDQIIKGIPIHKSTLTKWLQGERLPDTEMIRLLAQVLNADEFDELTLDFALQSDKALRAICSKIYTLISEIEVRSPQMPVDELDILSNRGIKHIRCLLADHHESQANLQKRVHKATRLAVIE